MNDIYDELIDFFELFGDSTEGKFVPLDSSPTNYKYFNSRDDYGIFVISDFKKDYRESCSGIVFETRIINIGNVIKKGYILNCSVGNAKSEFARVCESLILNDDEELAEEPSLWFDKWKEAFGNTNVNRSTYSVIGELAILIELRNHGYTSAVWNGPDMGVCDIVDPESDMYFEVKSTILRNSSVITLSEEFQSKKADYICFCRFEEDPNGYYSIDSLVKELIDSGYDEKNLNLGLKKLGIRNTSLRTMRYDLLESTYYPVKDNIPCITDFFINGEKPTCIENISYSVNLSGLRCQTEVPARPNNRNE